jgi:BASS family bile acid:Na+ symporter
MPFLAWSIGTLVGLPDDWMIGVILVGAVPGAMASNVITMTARGNVSYSVSLTTTATLLSPVVVPMVLYLTLNQTGVDAAALARQAFWGLLLQVFLPVILGHFLARNFPRVEHLTNRFAGVIANLVILWIIAVVVNANHAHLSQTLSMSHAQLVLVLLAVNILGYGGGWLGSILMGLPDTKRRALIIEVGMQNAGLGSTLATQLFPDRPAVALPCALYTFGCMLTGILLAQYWSRREPVAEASSPSPNHDE